MWLKIGNIKVCFACRVEVLFSIVSERRMRAAIKANLLQHFAERFVSDNFGLTTIFQKSTGGRLIIGGLIIIYKTSTGVAKHFRLILLFLVVIK